MLTDYDWHNKMFDYLLLNYLLRLYLFKKKLKSDPKTEVSIFFSG